VMAGDDRRVVVARLTALGRSTFERIRRQRAAGIERLLEPFTAAEREQLADLLERFVTSIDQVAAELSRAATTGQTRP
jgi:DNA-binding MarR family transcriptional regulator